MTSEEFLERVASEKALVVTRRTSIIPRERLESGRPLSEILAAGAPGPLVTVTYEHIVDPPASIETIDAWCARHPAHPLPADLRELLLRCNGIHLWADASTGRAYQGIAPIQEWTLARTKLWGPTVERAMLDDRFLAISYHENGDDQVALDTGAGGYFSMEPIGADTSRPIGRNVPELLDWLWRGRHAPHASS
jgi:hypothetical protein